MIPVNSVNSVNGLPATSPATSNLESSEGSKSGSFGDLVQGFLESTNEAQTSSEAAVNDLVTGKTDNVREVVLAVANAEMSFQLFMEIRNKLVDSYNELMRMQF